MRLVLVLLLVAACGGDDDDDDDGGAVRDGGGEPIECESSAGSTPASGVVRVGGTSGVWSNGPSVDGVVSTGRDWQWFGLAPQLQVETARAGDCVLYEWEPAFCDPACENGICYEGDCRPYPELISAGTLTVGIGSKRLELEADAPTFYGPTYRAALDAVPDPGTLVSVCAAGGAAGGFGVGLRAVEPLAGALPDDEVMELVDGGDLEIAWSGGDARVRLTLAADNEQHGLPWRAILWCDAADTGSLVVPQELVEAFPPVMRPPPENFACAGTDCPSSSLVRYRSARIDEPDLQVEVRVESAVQFWIEH